MSLREHLLSRVTDAFEELNIDENIINRLDEYFEDNDKEGEFLESLPKIDFYRINKDKLENTNKAYKSIMKHYVPGYKKKFFEILFKLGAVSICKQLQMESTYFWTKMEDMKEIIDDGVDSYKVLAVFTEDSLKKSYGINKQGLSFIYDIADKDIESLRKASEYLNINGKLLLKSVYCYKSDNEIVSNIIKELESSFIESIEVIIYDKSNLDLVKRVKDIVSSDMKVDLSDLVKEVRNKKIDNEVLGVLVGLCSLNVDKSKIIKNIVKFFMEVNYLKSMDSIYEILPVETYNCDTMFNIDSTLDIKAKYYIAWHACKYGDNETIRTILKNRLLQDKMEYEKAMELSSNKGQRVLSEVKNEVYPEHDFIEKLEEETINYLLSLISNNGMSSDIINAVSGFLHCDVEFKEVEEQLYKLTEIVIGYYNFNRELNNIVDKIKRIDRDNVKFFDRVIIILMLTYHTSSIVSLASEENKVEEILMYFLKLEEYEIKPEIQLRIIEYVLKSYVTTNVKDSLKLMLENLIIKHRKVILDNFKNQSAELKSHIIEILFSEKTEDAFKFIVGSFEETSKTVKEKIIEVMSKSPKYKELVIEKLLAKKQGEREVAIRILSNWDTSDIKEVLSNTLKHEKSQKNRDLLMKCLEIEEDKDSSGEEDGELSKEEFIKNILKGNKKVAINWLEFETLVKVKDKDGCVNDDYVKALILCYSIKGDIAISNDGNKLAKNLNSEDLMLFANEVFDRWLEKGAEAKKKWVLAFAAIYGGDEIIKKLKHKITEWPAKARGAIACEAIKALALNGSSEALLIVDSISRKFKYRQVKNAAVDALTFAADQMGMDREELSDKIVPNLEFDKNGERIFDYGNRRFTVRLTPNLQIEVYDENEKKLKNLPAPGKKDDEVKAKASNTEFKSFKKQLKTTISVQTERLDLALSSDRKWSKEAWLELFVNNPIMHQFAIGLIWGVYKNKILVDTFRYMEDGTFNTKDEDEFEMPESCEIALVHPLELSNEDKSLWKEQIESYEIVQPIQQLDRMIFTLEEKEKSMNYIDRFGGKVINGLSLMGKMNKFGWNKGSVTDGGGFCEYYTEDRTQGIGAELRFEGLYVGLTDDETVIYDLKFYKAGTVERGSYVYDEITEQNLIPLKNVPKRFFSEIMYQVDRTLSSSIETSHDWRKNAGLKK